MDLFGKKVELSFKGRSASKSYCGVCTTLVFFAFVVWSVIYLGQDMFLKENPETVFSELFTNDPPQVKIDQNNF